MWAPTVSHPLSFSEMGDPRGPPSPRVPHSKGLRVMGRASSLQTKDLVPLVPANKGVTGSFDFAQDLGSGLKRPLNAST